jgi:hypothetical protein
MMGWPWETCLCCGDLSHFIHAADSVGRRSHLQAWRGRAASPLAADLGVLRGLWYVDGERGSGGGSRLERFGFLGAVEAAVRGLTSLPAGAGLEGGMR